MPNSSVLLAVDTSTRTIGVALYDGSQVLSESTWTSIDYHTVELAPAVERAFSRADIRIEALSALAVALGPGSFTGLRIGLSLVKGMALNRHLPIIGVPTLEIQAYAQPLSTQPLTAVLRAGRGRLAVGWFEASENSWVMNKEIEVRTPRELAEKITRTTTICGELSEEEREMLQQASPLIQITPPAQSLRRPGFLAEIAWKRWKSGYSDDPSALSPIYLHYNEPIPG